MPRTYLANSSSLGIMKDDGANAGEKHWWDNTSFSSSGAHANAGQVLAACMMSTAYCCVKLEDNSWAHTIVSSTRVDQAVHAARTPSWG